MNQPSILDDCRTLAATAQAALKREEQLIESHIVMLEALGAIAKGGIAPVLIARNCLQLLEQIGRRNMDEPTSK